MGKKKKQNTIKRYVKEIYKEIEVCPDCKTPMQTTNIMYPTSPPRYVWACPKCNKRITSKNNGMLQFILEEE